MVNAETIANTEVLESIENSVHYKVRKECFFLNAENYEHFLKHGWCKITNVITPEEIKSFLDTFNYITNIEGFHMENQFLNTGCLHNPEIREKTSEVINKNWQTILPRIFDMNKVSGHTGGSFAVKPAHEDSELPVHQDSSFIDEELNYSLFVWVPFCDVNETNGAISVLSGSHLWGNTQRGFSVPWNLQKHSSVLNEYMQPVYTNAGDVLIFDPALVHSSKPNLSNETRHAITITAVKHNPDLIYYYRDENTPADVVERFAVSDEFFRIYDFASKPDEKVWKKTVIPYKSFDITESELIGLIEKYTPAL